MTTNVDWAQAVDGDFANAADWSGGAAPGANENAVFAAGGGAFTVSSTVDEAVLGVQLGANATLVISGGIFAARAGTDGGVNAGRIAVANGAELTVGGTIDNAGGVSLSGAGASTGSMMVLTSAATLAGGGQVVLESSGYAFEAAIAGGKNAILANVDNTITGIGEIGVSAGFRLVNDAAGVIEGGLTLGSWGAPGLRINNSGVIEATSLDTLDIYGATITGKGGLIATQTQALLEAAGCAISGQTLRTAAGGVIELVDSTVTVHGKIQDAGGILLQSATATLAGATTFNGGGYIAVGQGAAIVGASGGVGLQNAGDRISLSGGGLGGGGLSISNAAGGSITGFGTIVSGASTIVNEGVIAASNGPTPGVALVISGAIDNGATLEAGGNVGGATLVAQGAVNGAGQLIIKGGAFGGSVAEFESAFSEDVSFVQAGKSGRGHNPVSMLELARSQGFAGSVTGFSQAGLTALDLRDIGFVSPGEATFSGEKTSGVLTVTDGAHTAHIRLVGRFTDAAFTASSDGHGGTIVVAAPAQAQAHAGSPHAFIAAMASLGEPPALSARSGEAWSGHESILSAPKLGSA